jgi:hypothetical protein
LLENLLYNIDKLLRKINCFAKSYINMAELIRMETIMAQKENRQPEAITMVNNKLYFVDLFSTMQFA